MVSVSLVIVSSEEMNVPLEREIELKKALLLLEKQNRIATQENQSMSCWYYLAKDGQEVYRSSCTFPKESFDLYEQIVEEIEVEDSEQKELVLSWLSQTFGRKVTKQQKKKKEEKTKKPKKEKKQVRFRKDWLVTGCMLVIICFSVGMGIHLIGNQAVERPSLDMYLEEGRYLDAGKEYPAEHETIEDALFRLVRTEDESHIEKLDEFQNVYPTIQGAFDLAILRYDYEQAIGQYEKHVDQFTKDTYRLALIGYAYLKLDQLDQAKERLRECRDAELEKLILEYEQASLIIEEKQKEIEERQKKPTENKKKIEEAIEELYEAKEKLSQF